MSLRWVIFFSFCWLASVVNGQISFTATSDARQVIVGQYFTVSFTLENAKGSHFKAPSFIDFEVVGGPSTSTQMTIINGKTSQKMSYSYRLTAPKTGKYKIGSAYITVQGKEYVSDPIEIEVLKGRVQQSGGNQINTGDIIIEASIDYDTGYVGQQLILKYILYTNLNVRSYRPEGNFKFDGFFAQEIEGYQSRPEQIVRDGVPYFKRVIGVFALFPQQHGSFHIEPSQFTVGVSDRRSSNNLFFNTRLKNYRIRTNDLEVTIVPVPGKAPPSFSGAIGDFYMGSGVDRNRVTMDDAITLTLQVRGFGDSKFIEAPQQPFTDLFDIYDPNLLEEKSEVVGDRIQSTKTYEYLMIPKRTGTIKFNPELTYFDIDSTKYVTIYGRQYQVEVTKGTDRELADIEKVVEQIPRPGPVTGVYSINQTFAFSWGHLGANSVLLLGFCGLFVARSIKTRRENLDPALARKMSARIAAEKTLSKARLSLNDGKIDEFYIHLRRGLLGYLSDKTNQPTRQLSKEAIIDILASFHLSEQEEKLLTILQKGEQAIYASIAPGAEQEDYEASLAIIGAIEETLQ